MIIVNNSVNNLRGTPACLTDYSFNRPLANAVSVGSLFFATDTKIIYQVHLVGSVPTWETMGGGGGGTQNLNDVLYQGGQFTNDRQSNLNNFSWELYNVTNFNLKFTTLSLLEFGDNGIVYEFWNSVSEEYLTNLISITYSNGDIALGDFGGQFNGTHMYVNVSQNRIYFAPGGILGALFTPQNSIIGDGLNQINQTQFVVNDADKRIDIYLSGHNYLNIADNGGFIYYSLGDFNNDINGTCITFNDEELDMLLRADNSITLNTNQIFANGTLIQSTSGGSSGDHLKININGTPYVIALLNP